jgi:sugar phosphate isomerase/epimerase
VSAAVSDERLPLAAITDEFSPDIDVALGAMAALGITGAELRVIDGRNVLDLGDADVDRVAGLARARGVHVLGIASPLFKCTLPGAAPIDDRFQQDIFGSPYTFDDQSRLARRAFEVAARTGARMIRVFSYWRTVDPDRTAEAAVPALRSLADEAASRGLVIGLENEPACNVGTGRETARLLERLDHPALQVVWDPANAYVLGETPFPDGYRALPPARIGHVHAKDCRVRDFKPEWGLLGEMDVDWPGQLDALLADDYRGWLSLETHWRGPHGDALEASRLSGERLGDLAAAARRRHAAFRGGQSA